MTTAVSFRESLRAFLLTDADIAALVDESVHPSVLPEASHRRLPAIVYRVISNEGSFAHDGPVNLRHPRLQLDVWSLRRDEAEAVEDAVVRALLGYRGPMGDTGYTAGWRLEDSTDLYEEDTKLHRISLDFRGWYAPEEGGAS